MWGDLRYRNAGQWTDQDGEEFNPKQHYYVGGNTKVYGAVLFRMPSATSAPCTTSTACRPRGRSTYDDMEPWYTRAEHLYQVHGERGADPLEPPASAPYPYPAVSHEPRIEQLRARPEGRRAAPVPAAARDHDRRGRPGDQPVHPVRHVRRLRRAW